MIDIITFILFKCFKVITFSIHCLAHSAYILRVLSMLVLAT